MKRALLAGGLLGGYMYKNRLFSTQRRMFARYWEESNINTIAHIQAARLKGEELPLVMVALGDSAAQGLGASSPLGGYVPRTAAAVADMSGREVALINLSLSGAVIGSVLSTQIPALIGLGGAGVQPDIVTVDIGGNDVGYGQGLKEIATVANIMCTQLPAGSFIANVPSFGPTKHGKRARAISAILHEAAAGHTMIDLERFTSDMDLATYMFRYHALDFFHPNDRAYSAWAQLWSNAIAEKHGYPTVSIGDVGPYQPYMLMKPETGQDTE